jgi:hypothetical protein
MSSKQEHLNTSDSQLSTKAAKTDLTVIGILTVLGLLFSILNNLPGVIGILSALPAVIPKIKFIFNAVIAHQYSLLLALISFF